MNKSKHTPGPWEVVYRDDESFMCMTLIAPKGLMNPNNVGRLIDEPTEVQEKVIAITFHQLLPFSGYQAFDKDEQEANDRLIASAPEMLEALEGCLALFALGVNAMNKRSDPDEKRAKAREIEANVIRVIAKAKGGEDE